MKAFPRGSDQGSNGMDLRDYFAAKAMQTLLAELKEEYVISDVACDAYYVADAMMKARND